MVRGDYLPRKELKYTDHPCECGIKEIEMHVVCRVQPLYSDDEKIDEGNGRVE